MGLCSFTSRIATSTLLTNQGHTAPRPSLHKAHASSLLPQVARQQSQPKSETALCNVLRFGRHACRDHNTPTEATPLTSVLVWTTSKPCRTLS
eukprot:3877037-Amphidinium_carterae.1